MFTRDGMSVDDLGAGPALRLLEELELHVIEAHGAKFGPGKVEQLVPLRWSLAREQVHLVVAVEMVLVVAVAKLHALEQLVGDVRIAGGGQRVGNQSRPEKMPFSTVPGLMWPGQRAMHGTRKPPS